jgi:Transposase DDE domain
MNPTKNPRKDWRPTEGKKHKPAFAGCVLGKCILAGAKPKGQFVTARKDFRIVRDKFARDNGLPFGRLLTREYVLSVLEQDGHEYRSRVFCPLVTLWGWLSQCLSQDKSLNEAVSRVLANRVATGLPACSASSAGYTKARTRFPEAAMQRMAKEIGRKVHDKADGSWNWHGREVFLADGTCFTMPDTQENQLVYPQHGGSRNGIGFPIMRTVALVSLATGAVIDVAFGKMAGKGTGEMSLFRRLLDNLSPGNIVVTDRYFPAFGTVATLKQTGVDLVSVSHNSRKVDFSAGHVLGPKDHIVEWKKPHHTDYVVMDREAFDALPDRVPVREFVIDIDDRNGGKEQAIVVTTLTDPTIPQKEIADLYWQRWNCELDIRSIKHSLNMDVLRAKTPSMVHKEIWAHLLAYNLLRGTMVESAKRSEIHPRQLSIKGTMQAVESFTPAMMSIDGSQAVYDAFLTTVSAHRVGNRPGRQEPRYKKSRPAWDRYMQFPRHKSHRKLNREARVCVPLS